MCFVIHKSRVDNQKKNAKRRFGAWAIFEPKKLQHKKQSEPEINKNVNLKIYDGN